MDKLKLIECPRDAMQGLQDFVPTDTKAAYINEILSCGFDTVDFGSFVSPKAIPQLKDTSAVLSKLNISDTKLLAIVANERGAIDACEFDRIDYLGFPFSVSEEFQKRNTNSTIDESFKRVERIKEITDKHGKDMVLYLSMGLGNPYGEEWHPDIVTAWSEKLKDKLDIKIQAVSDTIGCGTPELVNFLFSTLIPSIGDDEFGAHLHALPENAKKLIKSSYSAGCRRFDVAIKGFGGCPMATDDLTGNMPTEKMLEWLNEHNISSGINERQFGIAMEKSLQVFP